MLEEKLTRVVGAFRPGVRDRPCQDGGEKEVVSKQVSQEGALITTVQRGSPADHANLQAGMVIVEANRKPVKGPEDLRALSAKTLGKGVLLLIRSKQGSRFVALKP